MRTTFEVVHGALGAQNSVLGGGRYDGLAEALGSKVPAPGIGFSIGEDRLVMTVGGERERLSRSTVSSPHWASAPCTRPGCLAREIRQSGYSVEVAPDGKLKRSMELANKLGARYTLIVGENEIASGRYALKNMSSGEQEQVARERDCAAAPRQQLNMQTVPLDFLGELRRTHTCGQLRAKDAGSRALLMGWVHRRRDLGGVIFIHLRDRDGVTQIVFHADVDQEVHAKAELLRSEYVIAVEGKVALRTPGHREYECRHRRSRGGRGKDLDSERIAHAAIPHGG